MDSPECELIVSARTTQCIKKLTFLPQGLVTATQKLNRRAVREHYAKEIDLAIKQM
jgi:hypothetical protein